MHKVASYIFVHDQDIILEYISVNKFNQLPNLIYVFVGSRPIDKLTELITSKKVIVCRDLPINIEHIPLYTSYTGWYALWRNGLIPSDMDYVNLFEYDVRIEHRFDNEIKDIMKHKYSFIAYMKLPKTSPLYIQKKLVKNIFRSIKKQEHIDMKRLVERNIKRDKYCTWPITCNTTWRKADLFQFMEWFEQHRKKVGKSKYAGHEFERAISFFLDIHFKHYIVVEGLISHFGLNSHRGSNRSRLWRSYLMN